MNAKVIGLGVVFVAFAVLTAEAFMEFGLLGFFEALNANMATRQVFADVVIGLAIAAGFIWRDARERGLPALPYIGATLLTGSFGPLAYLIHRELAAKSAVAAAPQQTARAV